MKLSFLRMQNWRGIRVSARAAQSRVRGKAFLGKQTKNSFELLSTFSAAESKVVAYILQKTQPTKNEFIGAYKTIARKLECDVTTVRNTFKKMMENDMLAKTDDERIWMLNPRLLVKGDIIVKARLMSKYDSLLGRPLSDWIITDSNGKTRYSCRRISNTRKRDTAKSDFIKVYHLFFETLSGLGGKESEVLNFLVCAMRNSDNTYTGPMKKIAENVNCSKATVQRAMDTLTDKGFVAMEFDCVWRINPSMVIKGNRNKEKVLMDDFLMIQAEYNEKRKARKNGKKQKTVKG